MTSNVRQDFGRAAGDQAAAQAGASSAPTLNNLTVVGVFNDTPALERAYRDLLSNGVAEDDVSVVRQGNDAAPPMSSDDTKAGTGTVTGGVAGAVLGGIAGLALLAIPGVGPLLAAGPLAVALGGALTGGAMGALAGSFAGLGMPTEHAAEYEAAVRGGGTFISVKTTDGDHAKRVAASLTQHGAEKVSHYQPAL